MLQIDGTVSDKSRSGDYGMPLFRLGFRPFFLAAGVFAVIAMAIWMASYLFAVDFHFALLSPVQWHAHEMVFGYLMAVIAGFLLTAIKNWTGLEVLRGKGLAALFALWLLARIMLLIDVGLPLWLIAAVDVSFMFILALVCLRPVIKVRQYKQAGILAKLILIAGFHLLYYLGIAGVLEHGERWGLYSAIYTVLALILVMMRRVMPMFINNGIDAQAGEDYQAKNRRWVDISSIVLLIVMWIADVFTDYIAVTASAAGLLAVLHLVRLAGWYTRLIWSKPLVWVLVMAYIGLIAGFALKSFSGISNIFPHLALHAITVGGMGLVTIGMMSRVALGHTGRDVFNPPRTLFWCFLLLGAGFVVRALLPLFTMAYYPFWIAASQALWILAFAVFVIVYAPMLLSARVDGRDG